MKKNLPLVALVRIRTPPLPASGVTILKRDRKQQTWRAYTDSCVGISEQHALWAIS